MKQSAQERGLGDYEIEDVVQHIVHISGHIWGTLY